MRFSHRFSLLKLRCLACIISMAAINIAVGAVLLLKTPKISLKKITNFSAVVALRNVFSLQPEIHLGSAQDRRLVEEEKCKLIALGILLKRILILLGMLCHYNQQPDDTGTRILQFSKSEKNPIFSLNSKHSIYFLSDLCWAVAATTLHFGIYKSSEREFITPH